jgi:hypothetical protein
MSWQVFFTKRALKQLNELPLRFKKETRALTNEMERFGPLRYNWKNFGKFKGSDDLYHCHIHKGRPTYVVCWQIKDKKFQVIEVYYVGTHEKAPY